MDSIQPNDSKPGDRKGTSSVEMNTSNEGIIACNNTANANNARFCNTAARTNTLDESDDLEGHLFRKDSENEGMKDVDNPVVIATAYSTPVIASNSNDNDGTPNKSTLGYYTTAPSTKAPPGLSYLQTLREYRHNRCIMTPLSTLVLIAITLSSLTSLLFMIPQFIIGLFLGPFVKRQFWLIEFLYRWDIAGWGHVKLMEMVQKRHTGNNIKYSNKTATTVNEPTDPKKKLKQLGFLGHSDTIYQRITVVPGRVFVHPIPQFIDNVCYLIVCLPQNKSSMANNSQSSNENLPIIGVLIDVGETRRTLAYIECIYELFYEQEYPRSDYYRNSGDEAGNINITGMGIEIHTILSTHKHHDHTAGVGELVDYLEQARCRLSKRVCVSGGVENDAEGDSHKIYNMSPGKVVVVGGAVEHVPHCNMFVKNHCFIPLPCVSIDINGTVVVNDMNSVACIECIGVPSHTRGSIIYALRNHSARNKDVQTLHEVGVHSHLFTGDAIFSGGCGVSFEADLEYDNFVKRPNKLRKKNGSSSFRPGAGTLSSERCFTEVLVRANKSIWEKVQQQDGEVRDLLSRTLLYPGHEYTTDLMMRQFDPKTTTSDGHWTKMAPSIFFEASSHYFVSAHKRALPQGQKLLSLPTSLDKEMIVNPNFRSLKRRGEHIVIALKLWHEFGAKNPISMCEEEVKPPMTIKRRISSSPFRTVYAQDLDMIVEDLRSGTLTTSSAADRIELIQSRTDEKLIGRRPIPNHLPSHNKVYLGIIALAVLGSPPSGVTVSDALVMDLAAPIDSTDYILISKNRLVSALSCLGLIPPYDSIPIQDMINSLWKEARLDDMPNLENGITNVGNKDDLIELGLLKLALFGVSLNQSPSYKYCLPCQEPKPTYSKSSWTTQSLMKRTNGELVRHDAEKCPLCQDITRQCSRSNHV